MKSVLYLLIVIVWFMYCSKINIQLKPLKVSFGDIRNGLGWLFAVLAIICFQLSGYKKGNLDGYKEALYDVKVEFENRPDNLTNSTK